MNKMKNNQYNGWDISKGDYEISDDSTETYRTHVIRKKRFKKAFSIVLYFIVLIIVTIILVAPL